MSEPRNPFPGLRPFEPEENDVFFGREQQVRDVLERLDQSSFVAVLGSSGCGKSSLVRAGLIPALQGGGIHHAGSYWRIAVTRPGGSPISNLARALAMPSVIPDEIEDPEMHLAFIEATLRRGSHGLVDAVELARFDPQENLVVVVDQFEELFRFRSAVKEKQRDEAAAFVKLLLKASFDETLPVFVVITMRSTFLGEAAEYPGLPEAINRGQYLVPWMSRDQQRLAIEGPLAVSGVSAKPRLVGRLLNEIAEERDPLPILQHALMRTFDNWKDAGEPDQPLDVDHYEAAGGSNALADHAEEAYQEQRDQGRGAVVEQLFRCLTEQVAGSGVRRPTSMRDLHEITDASEDDLCRVIEGFRRADRCFLVPPEGTDLTDETIVDISHESLIRVWPALGRWLRRESSSAVLYRRLAQTAKLRKLGQARLLSGIELSNVLTWRKETRPNSAWAVRYDEPDDEREGGTFELVERFTAASLRKRRILRALVLSPLMLFLFIGVQTYREQREVDRAQREADRVKIEQQHRALNQEEREALSRRLAQLSKSSWDSGVVDDAILFAIEALNVAGIPEARSSLLHALDRSPHLERYLSEEQTSLDAVAMRPDSRELAIAGRGGFIKLVDIPDGAARQKLASSLASISSLAFSQDGSLLAAGGCWRRRLSIGASVGQSNQEDDRVVESHERRETCERGRVVAWSRRDGELEDPRARSFDEEIVGLTFWGDAADSRQSGLAVLGKSGGLWMLDESLGEGDREPLFQHSGLGIAADDSKLVAVGCSSPRPKEDGSCGELEVLVRPVDGEDARYKFLVEKLSSALAIAPGGKEIAVAFCSKPESESESAVCSWQIRLLVDDRGRKLAVPEDSGVESLAFTLDGSLIIGTDEGPVWITGTDERPVWKRGRGGSRSSKKLTGHGQKVRSIVLDPTGDRFVSVGAGGRAISWSLEANDKLRTTLAADARQYGKLDFFDQGRQLVAGSDRGGHRAWRLEPPAEADRFGMPGATAFFAAASPRGDRFAFGDRRKGILLFVEGEEEPKVVHKDSRKVVGLSFIRGGDTLIFNDRCQVSAYDVAKGDVMRLWQLPDCQEAHNSMRKLVVDPISMLAAVVGRSNVYVLDLDQDPVRETQAFELQTEAQGRREVDVVFFPSRDGTVLREEPAPGDPVSRGGLGLAIGGGRIRLYDLETGDEQDALAGSTGKASRLAVSPDGRILAASSAGKVVLWDLATNLMIDSLDFDSVNDLVFNPDGSRLAVSGRQVDLLDMNIATWKRVGCDLVGHPLRSVEREELRIGGRAACGEQASEQPASAQ